MQFQFLYCPDHSMCFMRRKLYTVRLYGQADLLLCQWERRDTDAITHAKDNIILLIEGRIRKEEKGVGYWVQAGADRG